LTFWSFSGEKRTAARASRKLMAGEDSRYPPAPMPKARTSSDGATERRAERRGAARPGRARRSSNAARPAAVVLRRRGVRHGAFRVERPPPLDLRDPAVLAALEARWSADRPILLPGALALGPHRADVRSTLALFDRLRGGASFQDAVWRRLARSREFEPAGVTVDLADAREIEKVFAHARRGGRIVARDLYAKLSWIAHDPRDASLRIRFSFGAEALLDWQMETRRAPWAERFAEALFLECLVISGDAALRGAIDRLCGRRARLGERIVYSNAPGGGATFHHDDEPRQLGVVYGQLAGETAWLALPKRALAEHVAAASRGALRRRAGTAQEALRALDEDDDPALGRLLNATPAFTRRLAAAGALVHLRPGDALLLPSHGPDDVCWHSVFALGTRPSLAHSYGVFPSAKRRRAVASRSRLR
jgi:hypothetical protein